MRILLLGYYHPRYMKPLKEWAARLRKAGWDAAEVYPDAFYKEDVLERLQEEFDVIVYFGHGVPGAWSAFGRIGGNDFKGLVVKNPERILLSLSCYSLDSSRGDSLCGAAIDNQLAKYATGYEDRIKYCENLETLNAIMQEIVGKKDGSIEHLFSAIRATDGVSCKFLTRGLCKA